jgi:DNA replicative helicase MCM subunit Mcm2 (Cdc46/Mcm family)
VITVRKLIKELEEVQGSNIALADLIDAAKGKGIEESKIEEIIEKMKRDGELYEPKQGIIRSMPK